MTLNFKKYVCLKLSLQTEFLIQSHNSISFMFPQYIDLCPGGKQNLWSQAKELNLRQPGFCMPDMLLFGQPSKANNYSRELYQAELAWDKQPEVF